MKKILIELIIVFQFIFIFLLESSLSKEPPQIILTIAPENLLELNEVEKERALEALNNLMNDARIAERRGAVGLTDEEKLWVEMVKKYLSGEFSDELVFGDISSYFEQAKIDLAKEKKSERALNFLNATLEEIHGSHDGKISYYSFWALLKKLLSLQQGEESRINSKMGPKEILSKQALFFLRQEKSRSFFSNFKLSCDLLLRGNKRSLPFQLVLPYISGVWAPTRTPYLSGVFIRLGVNLSVAPSSQRAFYIILFDHDAEFDHGGAIADRFFKSKSLEDYIEKVLRLNLAIRRALEFLRERKIPGFDYSLLSDHFHENVLSLPRRPDRFSNFFLQGEIIESIADSWEGNFGLLKDTIFPLSTALNVFWNDDPYLKQFDFSGLDPGNLLLKLASEEKIKFLDVLIKGRKSPYFPRDELLAAQLDQYREFALDRGFSLFRGTDFGIVWGAAIGHKFNLRFLDLVDEFRFRIKHDSAPGPSFFSRETDLDLFTPSTPKHFWQHVLDDKWRGRFFYVQTSLSLPISGATVDSFKDFASQLARLPVGYFSLSNLKLEEISQIFDALFLTEELDAHLTGVSLDLLSANRSDGGNKVKINKFRDHFLAGAGPRLLYDFFHNVFEKIEDKDRRILYLEKFDSYLQALESWIKANHPSSVRLSFLLRYVKRERTKAIARGYLGGLVDRLGGSSLEALSRLFEVRGDVKDYPEFKEKFPELANLDLRVNTALDGPFDSLQAFFDALVAAELPLRKEKEGSVSSLASRARIYLFQRLIVDWDFWKKRISSEEQMMKFIQLYRTFYAEFDFPMITRPEDFTLPQMIVRALFPRSVPVRYKSRFLSRFLGETDPNFSQGILAGLVSGVDSTNMSSGEKIILLSQLTGFYLEDLPPASKLFRNAVRGLSFSTILLLHERDRNILLNFAAWYGGYISPLELRVMYERLDDLLNKLELQNVIVMRKKDRLIATTINKIEELMERVYSYDLGELLELDSFLETLSHRDRKNGVASISSELKTAISIKKKLGSFQRGLSGSLCPISIAQILKNVTK